jgi:hypothetical protein
MRRTVRLLLVALLTIAGAAVAVPASAASCGVSWGSLPKDLPEMDRSALVDVRVGTHACWDRVVFDLDGPAAGYHVEYVDAVTQDGSGAVVPVPGGARLHVRLHHPSYDDQGNSTLPGAGVGEPVAHVPGFPTLRSVLYTGSFEGDTTIGVGTRARLPFRVFLLDGPGDGARIVLDVAHRWS